jgi:transcriptional regulator with XRE-family HTH domain
MELADVREVMGWSQADAAYLLGIPQRTVSRMERGDRVVLTDDQAVKLERMRVLARRKEQGMTEGSRVQAEARAAHEIARAAAAAERKAVADARLEEIHRDKAAHEAKKASRRG